MIDNGYKVTFGKDGRIIELKDNEDDKCILINSHYVTRDVDLNECNSEIIKAGTILPHNDETAKGILLDDVDTRDVNCTGKLIVHGFIDKSVLPEEPTKEALEALSMIKFI